MPRIKRSRSDSFRTKELNRKLSFSPSEPFTTLDRSSAEPSLREKIRLRKCNTLDKDLTLESEAKKYSDYIEEETLMHLSHTIRTADSMVESGYDLCEELARHDNVLKKTDHDLHSIEQDIHETNWTLRSMNSLRGKVANLILRKKPKVDEDDCVASDDGSLRVYKSRSAPVNFVSEPQSKGNKQHQIKRGVNHLIKTLDIMKYQHLEIEDELKHQERHLNDFEEHVERLQHDVHHQNYMIKKISNK